MKYLGWLSKKVHSLLALAKTKTKPLSHRAKLALTKLVGLMYKLTIFGLAAFSFMMFVMKAPTIHQEYIRKYVGSSVYYVSATGHGGGTAFSMKAASGVTYFVTNDHICAGSETGKVQIWSELGPLGWFPIVERSQTTDLCLVAAPFYEIGLDLAVNGTYKGDRVQAVGHPNLMELTLSNIGEVIQVGATVLSDKAEVPHKASPRFQTTKCDETNPKFKILKLKNGQLICTITVPSVFFTNVLVQPGNSGSPLVNFQGDVVGVISGVDEYGWAVAVSYSELATFLSNH